MNLRFFKIPVSSIAKAEEELNQVLSKHRISSVEKEFVANGANSFWAISSLCRGTKHRFLNDMTLL